MESETYKGEIQSKERLQCVLTQIKIEIKTSEAKYRAGYVSDMFKSEFR